MRNGTWQERWTAKTAQRTSGAFFIAILTLPFAQSASAQQPSSAPAATETKKATVAASSAAASTMTPIHIDAGGTGRIFDGVGAISGGGGNSRLLIDYPAKQRDQILDYLFKPGYGASMQLLKIEIGGDANSTDGSEPSIEHARGVVNCNAGYEFWLAGQAKLRNPKIKLYGLAWAAPGWIGDGKFWSQDMVDYLSKWLSCAHTHGLDIDYLGGWNERDFDKTWYENLHATLAAKYPRIQIVGADSDWHVADAMAEDPAFAKAIDIVGVHYSCEGGDGGNANSCQSTQNGLATRKPLWDSENGSQDDNTGAGALIRAITRGYIDAKMTALLNWPLIAAITPNLPYPTVGLMVAGEPWSGNYSVGKNLWVTAHVAQFTEPGWQFLDGASGYLGGDRTRGSYVSLRSPSGTDWSTVVETTTATSTSTGLFKLDKQFAHKPVHVRASDLNSTAEGDQFANVADLQPDKSGSYQFTFRPGFVYTFSSLASSGKGEAAAPSAGRLRLPYRDNFDGYGSGQEARYASDMQGSFEVQPCTAGRSGSCLQQMAAVKPIEWQDDSDAFTLLGDPAWTDYTVSVDAVLVKPGTLELIGRAGTQKRPQSHQQGYLLQVANTGAWTVLKSDTSGKRTTLASGASSSLGIGQWHHFSLSLKADTITALVDGQRLTALKDSSYQSGQIGLGLTGYDTDQFDNLAITPE